MVFRLDWFWPDLIELSSFTYDRNLNFSDWVKLGYLPISADINIFVILVDKIRIFSMSKLFSLHFLAYYFIFLQRRILDACSFWYTTTIMAIFYYAGSLTFLYLSKYWHVLFICIKKVLDCYVYYHRTIIITGYERYFSHLKQKIGTYLI